MLSRIFKLSKKVGRSPIPANQDLEVVYKAFSEFVGSDSSSIPLWDSYRNQIKESWRFFYWPVSVLIQLSQRVSLSPAQIDMTNQLSTARTLPVPLGEIVEVALDIAKKNNDIAIFSEKTDPFLENEKIFAVVPLPKKIKKNCGVTIKHAKDMLSRIYKYSQDSTPHKLLEVGCGNGYLTYGLGVLDVGEVFGVDIEFPLYTSICEQPTVLNWFVKKNRNVLNNVHIEINDCHELKYADDEFDIVHSHSVLEHISDLQKAFMEIHRVLKPGGIAYHTFDPWFSPQGGHSLCTLDFPWGQVRLNEKVFDDYIKKYRPHEYEHVLNFYHGSFPKPRNTLKDIENIIFQTGFQILEWHESKKRFDNHYQFLSKEVFTECEKAYPEIAVRDLLANSCRIILKKK
jgi:SAM-dependent methyltransferase